MCAFLYTICVLALWVNSFPIHTRQPSNGCMCYCQSTVYPREIYSMACLDSEKYVNIYNTQAYMHKEPLNSLFSELHSKWYLPLCSFLRYLGSLRLFFTLVQAFLLLFLPRQCFQNKAAVSESKPHLVRANARQKYKAPGLRKFLTTLFPKQKIFISIFYKFNIIILYI